VMYCAVLYSTSVLGHCTVLYCMGGPQSAMLQYTVPLHVLYLDEVDPPAGLIPVAINLLTHTVQYNTVLYCMQYGTVQAREWIY